MEPIPESTEAVDEFGPFSSDGDLLEQLRDRADAVVAIVPDCVGLSVAVLADDLTLTLVASDGEVALLDAVQYLTGGPCVDGAKADQVLEYHPEPDATDERGWQTFAQASAARSVASTLTLPIVVEGRVAGSVNLYGASAHSFSGHHDELAQIFGAWAPGAVTNADLSFSTRQAAERAPRQLQETYRIEVAAGILAGREGVDIDTARVHLQDAAARAGVRTAQLAEVVIGLTGERGGP